MSSIFRLSNNGIKSLIVGITEVKYNIPHIFSVNETLSIDTIIYDAVTLTMISLNFFG